MRILLSDRTTKNTVFLEVFEDGERIYVNEHDLSDPTEVEV